jgi:hypothetical protein
MSRVDQPKPADRVVVLPSGDDVLVRCAGCAEQERVSAEPVARFLAEVQAFVHAHSGCDVDTAVRAPRQRVVGVE